MKKLPRQRKPSEGIFNEAGCSKIKCLRLQDKPIQYQRLSLIQKNFAYINFVMVYVKLKRLEVELFERR